ncbi:hypothetical protein OCAR_5824 [Afipia carboxidovorans OM5]|nr:hypothetical protein OCAR_5824 [Afipia carboxidovorans OM5]
MNSRANKAAVFEFKRSRILLEQITRTAIADLSESSLFSIDHTKYSLVVS